MIFSLDVMRARKGDCLMVHHGTPQERHLIMIDGGPRQVFGPFLKPRIQKVRAALNVDANNPLQVDLLMVSHVDDDHIQGILDLTRELITAQLEHRPQLVQVLSFWHNSFENIIGHSPAELTAAFRQKFGPASLDGNPPSDLTVDGHCACDEETIISTLKVLASIQQGAQLRSDANRLQFPLNPEFNGRLVMAGGAHQRIEVVNGLDFSVIGPATPELENLHKKHQAWLQELQKKDLTAEDALAAYVDKSVPNLSSIVVLAESEEGSMLLTGDARGDKILKGLELSGRLALGKEMEVDILKVPHHGSANNLDNDFFQRIRAKHYMFSGDGQHGNPERESLEMLLNARADEDYKIHLTYPIEEIDKERKLDWEKEQAKEKKKKEKDPSKKVRPDWSPAKHSLTEFFKKHPSFAKKVRIVQAGTPHVIDLGEPLGF